METKETQLLKSPEVDLPVHNVFVNFFLENDLEKAEMEWFRSKICPVRVEDKQKKTESDCRRVDIVTEYESGKLMEKKNKLLLRLSETETIWLLSLTSFCEDNCESIEKVLRENQTYKMKKTKKEIIRKRCMADVQTPRRMVKSTGVFTTEIIMEDSLVLASEWELFDTYNALDKCERSPSKNYLKFVEPAKSKSTDTKTSKEDEAMKMFGSSRFQYVSLVMERLLASNCFQSKQSIFKKKFRTRYDLEPTLFTYAIELLWSYQKNLEIPLAVTSMDWNPSNQDLLAVGYGDLTFGRRSLGLVCVWCSKNPRQPEKQIHFEDSITSLHFSRYRPNILAVGTRRGNVYVLDISNEKGNVKLLKSSKMHPGPIWKVEWFLFTELLLKAEDLLVVGEDGVLMIFSTSASRNTKDLLKLEYVTTTQKYPEKISKKRVYRCPPVFYETFEKKIFSGLSFSICHQGCFCYISTKEGVVLKCNLRNPSMLDGIFFAHCGPVYTVQHSLVTDLIYLTCGADWSVKIWMEGITQPLLILQQKVSFLSEAPVLCAKWSPTIPTLIASISETELSLWDIAGNVLCPVTKRCFQNCGKMCTLLFSSNGAVGTENIVVGGDDGVVKVLHLSELPRIPFLQKEALISAIRRALLRNKNELYVKFQRRIKAHGDELKTHVLSAL